MRPDIAKTSPRGNVALGHKRTSLHVWVMSALPPKAYIRGLAARAKGGDGIMKAFVFACIAAVIIAIIGAIVLGGIQESADHAFSSSAVRLGP